MFNGPADFGRTSGRRASGGAQGRGGEGGGSTTWWGLAKDTVLVGYPATLAPILRAGYGHIATGGAQKL